MEDNTHVTIYRRVREEKILHWDHNVQILELLKHETFSRVRWGMYIDKIEEYHAINVIA